MQLAPMGGYLLRDFEEFLVKPGGPLRPDLEPLPCRPLR